MLHSEPRRYISVTNYTDDCTVVARSLLFAVRVFKLDWAFTHKQLFPLQSLKNMTVKLRVCVIIRLMFAYVGAVFNNVQ